MCGLLGEFYFISTFGCRINVKMLMVQCNAGTKNIGEPWKCAELNREMCHSQLLRNIRVRRLLNTGIDTYVFKKPCSDYRREGCEHVTFQQIIVPIPGPPAQSYMRN